jgi:hypothetical protein
VVSFFVFFFKRACEGGREKGFITQSLTWECHRRLLGRLFSHHVLSDAKGVGMSELREFCLLIFSFQGAVSFFVFFFLRGSVFLHSIEKSCLL